MISCWCSTIFRNRRSALFYVRGASWRPCVCVNRCSKRDIGPEHGKITMFGSGYGEMSGDTKSIPSLIKALADQRSGGYVSSSATKVLKQFGPETRRCVSADSEFVRYVVTAIDDESDYIRKYALGLIGSVEPAVAVPPLVEKLKLRNYKTRENTVKALLIIRDSKGLKAVRKAERMWRKGQDYTG